MLYTPSASMKSNQKLSLSNEAKLSSDKFKTLGLDSSSGSQSIKPGKLSKPAEEFHDCSTYSYQNCLTHYYARCPEKEASSSGLNGDEDDDHGSLRLHELSQLLNMVDFENENLQQLLVQAIKSSKTQGLNLNTSSCEEINQFSNQIQMPNSKYSFEQFKLENYIMKDAIQFWTKPDVTELFHLGETVVRLTRDYECCRNFM